MKIYIVTEHYGDGCNYYGELNVAFYDSFQKATDHLYNLITDDTFDYRFNAASEVISVRPSEFDEQEFRIEEVEVK